MMIITGLATLLCVAMVVSAIAARRSALRASRCGAACWNLLGIGCLVIGVLAICAWSRGGGGAAIPGAEMPNSAALTPGHSELESGMGDRSPDRAVTTMIELEAEEAGDETQESARAEDTWTPELMSQVEIDFEARPDWVEHADQDVGEIHQISVVSGPYLRQRRARRELDEQLKQATDEYINELVGNAAAAAWIDLDPVQIRQRFVAPEHFYDERLVSPTVGVMYQSHALLELGPEFHEDIDRAWHQILARAQLAKVALVAWIVLGTLVLTFGYFQADTATKGFYTGRLQFVAAVAILGLVVSSLLLARANPWLWP